MGMKVVSPLSLTLAFSFFPLFLAVSSVPQPYMTEMKIAPSAHDHPVLYHLKRIMGILSEAIGLAIAVVSLYFVCRRLCTNNNNGANTNANAGVAEINIELRPAIEQDMEADEENRLDIVRLCIDDNANAAVPDLNIEINQAIELGVEAAEDNLLDLILSCINNRNNSANANVAFQNLNIEIPQAIEQVVEVDEENQVDLMQLSQTYCHLGSLNL